VAELDPGDSGWDPFEDDGAFQEASVDDLFSAGDRTSEAARAPFNYVEEKQRAKISKAHRENDMRSRFFSWASKVAAWTIAANFAVFAAYLTIQALRPGAIPDGVMLAWISATVVEILGIVAIIARHLFPGRKNGMQIKPASSE